MNGVICNKWNDKMVKEPTKTVAISYAIKIEYYRVLLHEEDACWLSHLSAAIAAAIEGGKCLRLSEGSSSDSGAVD